MTSALTRAALLLAMSLAIGGPAQAAGEQHDHQDAAATPPQALPPGTQPNDAPSLPALGSAEDMLKAMESMRPHDHDACCKLSKSPPTSKGHPPH